MKLAKLFRDGETVLSYFELRRRTRLTWAQFNTRLRNAINKGFLADVDEGYIIRKIR